MSKERELLKECRLLLDDPINATRGYYLRKKVTEFLAQPEQATLKLRESLATETFNDAVSEALAAKPVAWKGKTYGNLHHVDYGNSIPLYTSPPKREPLSDKEILNLWANKAPANEYECVRLVEKAHGIGGWE